MIEFRKDKGPWSCCDEDWECDELAAAIVEDGRWWWMAACDNEQHIATALQRHAEAKALGDVQGEHWIWFETATEGPRFDGATWPVEVA